MVNFGFHRRMVIDILARIQSLMSLIIQTSLYWMATMLQVSIFLSFCLVRTFHDASLILHRIGWLLGIAIVLFIPTEQTLASQSMTYVVSHYEFARFELSDKSLNLSAASEIQVDDLLHEHFLSLRFKHAFSQKYELTYGSILIDRCNAKELNNICRKNTRLGTAHPFYDGVEWFHSSV